MITSAIRAEDWRVIGHGGKHIELRHDGAGARWWMPGTPSDWRALANLLADLRRAVERQHDRRA